MTYAYNTHGLPAVGNGLPGLPIRRDGAGEAEGAVVGEPYTLIHGQGSAISSSAGPMHIAFTDVSSNTSQFIEFGRPVAGVWYARRLAISEDKSLLAFLVLGSNSGAQNGFLALVSTKERAVVSTIKMPSAIANVGGVGIHVKNNVLALCYGPLSGPYSFKYYDLDYVIASNGSTIEDLVAFDTESSSGFSYIIEFSPDGKMIAIGSGEYNSSSSTSGSPVKTLRKWPSKGAMASAGGAAARVALDFSKDSNFFYYRDTSTSSSSATVFKILRDEDENPDVPVNWAVAYPTSNTRLGMQGKNLLYLDSTPVLRVRRNSYESSDTWDYFLYPTPGALIHAISPDGRWAVSSTSGTAMVLQRLDHHIEALDGADTNARRTFSLQYPTQNGLIQMIGGLVEND